MRSYYAVVMAVMAQFTGSWDQAQAAVADALLDAAARAAWN